MKNTKRHLYLTGKTRLSKIKAGVFNSNLLWYKISRQEISLGKGINPTILSPTIGKIVVQTGLFSLGMATSLGEKKL